MTRITRKAILRFTSVVLLPESCTECDHAPERLGGSDRLVMRFPLLKFPS
jgi:hypothetical protein